jgi:4-hydroxy-tetrahydrodipicolinate reductase
LQEAAALLACELAEAVIVEAHHPQKRDAPSGTALDTARRLQEARSEPDGGAVPIHSLRLPGVLARQEILFGAPGERVQLTHEVIGREAYGAGILASLRHASRAYGVACGLRVALDDA